MATSERKTADLARGARIRAQVLEIQAEGDLLVSYNGALIRVKNHAGQIFKVGDVLSLQVVGLHPLEFKIFVKAAATFDRMI